MSHSIISQSGRLIDVMNPRPEDITIEDIAAGLILGKTERYGSRTRGRYYVAEHSVHVANLVAARMLNPELKKLKCITEDFTTSLVKAAGLHDGVEAYLGDIVQPLKACLPDYKAIEHVWEIALGERFAISPDLLSSPTVKKADHDIFRCELVLMAKDEPRCYGETRDNVVAHLDCIRKEYPGIDGMGWGAERARLEFLDLCNTLGIK